MVPKGNEVRAQPLARTKPAADHRHVAVRDGNFLRARNRRGLRIAYRPGARLLHLDRFARQASLRAAKPVTGKQTVCHHHVLAPVNLQRMVVRDVLHHSVLETDVASAGKRGDDAAPLAVEHTARHRNVADAVRRIGARNEVVEEDRPMPLA